LRGGSPEPEKEGKGGAGGGRDDRESDGKKNAEAARAQENEEEQNRQKLEEMERREQQHREEKEKQQREERENEEEGRIKAEEEAARIKAEAEKPLKDYADAEVRALLVSSMLLSEVTPLQVAEEAGLAGGGALLEAWTAPDAAPDDPDHQLAVRAIRLWLTRKSLAAMRPWVLGAEPGAAPAPGCVAVTGSPVDGAAVDGAAVDGAVMAVDGVATAVDGVATAGDDVVVDGAAAASDAAPMDVDVPPLEEHREGREEGSASERARAEGETTTATDDIPPLQTEAAAVAAVAATAIAAAPATAGEGGCAGAGAGPKPEMTAAAVVASLDPASLDPPLHVEHLYEHTLRVLSAPPGELPKEPEAWIPRDPNGGHSQTGRPPKCIVCVIHKKGVCGTASAPNKCHRRKHLFDRMSLTGQDAPPPSEVELAKIDSSDLLGLAPDDEIVGELLQAQASLAATLWVTRTLAAKALAGAAAAAKAEAAEREMQNGWEEETERYEERWRGGKWREEYYRRKGLPSAEAREAAAAGGGGGGALTPGGSSQLSPGGSCRELVELVDPLVETGDEADALCAVCGGGESEEPNEIVFCERCEVAVHQDCYGVVDVPEGDWLCWPCHVAEANEIATGRPPSRPPRWLREAGDGALYDPRPPCCLCPVKRGALRAVIEPPRPPPDLQPQPQLTLQPLPVPQPQHHRRAEPESAPAEGTETGTGTGAWAGEAAAAAAAAGTRAVAEAVTTVGVWPLGTEEETGAAAGDGTGTGVGERDSSSGAGGNDISGGALVPVAVAAAAADDVGVNIDADTVAKSLGTTANAVDTGEAAGAAEGAVIGVTAQETTTTANALPPTATAGVGSSDALPPCSPTAVRCAAVVGYGPGVPSCSRRGGAWVDEAGEAGAGRGLGLAEGGEREAGGGRRVIRWAHIVCAQCIPGVEMASSPELGVASAVVQGLEKIPRSAFEADCIACRRATGAVVACAAPGCALTFHPLCARRNGWLLSDVTHQDSPRHGFCGRHSVTERRRLAGHAPLRDHEEAEAEAEAEAAAEAAEAGGGSGSKHGGGGGRGRGRGLNRPPLAGGRGGGRGPTLGRPKGSYTKRRPPPTREEMELLKRARFGLEKLRLLCERVLRREKFKRQETELQAELWTLQMAGLDDGGGSDGRGGAEASGSPPPTPRSLRVYMTPTSAAQANTTLPPGFSYQVVAKPTKPSPSRPRARE
jgi:hypothetical protein